MYAQELSKLIKDSELKYYTAVYYITLEVIKYNKYIIYCVSVKTIVLNNIYTAIYIYFLNNCAYIDLNLFN